MNNGAPSTLSSYNYSWNATYKYEFEAKTGKTFYWAAPLYSMSLPAQTASNYAADFSLRLWISKDSDVSDMGKNLIVYVVVSDISL
jgi:hypothetical protein